MLNEQGHFQIHGLPDGIIFISMTYPSGPAVPAYRLSSKNKCLDPRRRLLAFWWAESRAIFAT